mmetsp:Transcript_48018/g.139069  ORF Transcript_48018/g.139069 Transcript_48018/m.139069 type:complete len:685 (-) Transcript_48018:60-2114(-)
MMAESPGLSALHGLASKVDQSPQASVAALGLVIGALVANYGYSLMKPLFVTSCSIYFTVLSFLLCQEAPNPHVAAWAPAVSAAIGVFSLKLWNFVYPGFLFAVGSVLGGTSVFVAFQVFVSKSEPIATVAATVVGSLLSGLSFVRFHNVYWRLLLPPAGGLLAAAGLRYFVAALESPDARWTQFALEIAAGGGVVLGLSGVIFWTTWIVSALLGWYLQLAPLAGLRPEQSLVPESVAGRCLWLLGPDGLLGSGYGKRPGTPMEHKLAARKLPQLPGSLEPAGEPLLDPSMAEDTDGNGKPPMPLRRQSTPELMTDVTSEVMQGDYRPEVALLVAVTSVACLNWLLSAQPILFRGHAVLMSMAFLLLATAGMISYASKNCPLAPRCCGPTGTRLLRHFTHGTLNGLALACAVGGYVCIFMNHQQAGASQFGLGRRESWSRSIHVWVGYLVLLLLLIQALSGIAKLYFLALFGTRKATFHHSLGRAMYCLAAANQLIGFTFPGLLPTWATPLLAAMLIVTVGTTLFFLEEKNRLAAAKKSFEAAAARRQLEDTARQNSSTSGTGSVPMQREGTTAAIGAAAVKAIERESGRFLLQKVFTEWSRAVQQTQLENAAVALEGQDRIVQFLSQELVDGAACSRRQNTSFSEAGEEGPLYFDLRDGEEGTYAPSSASGPASRHASQVEAEG